jgi:hypothetical protein
MTDPGQRALRKRKTVDYTLEDLSDVEEQSSGGESDDSESDEEEEPAAEDPKVFSTHRERVNALARRRHREDKAPVVRTGKKTTPWTLESAVKLCDLTQRLETRGVALRADDTRQISCWNEQRLIGIRPGRRKLLMDTSKCAHGTLEKSPKINHMQSRGKTPEMAAKRAKMSAHKKSAASLGRPPQHAVEGAAIFLLISFFRFFVNDFDAIWEVAPVFDGLEADFMMRKKRVADADARWIPIQMKSVTGCDIGKQNNYKGLFHGSYPFMFCVCIGMVNYEHRSYEYVKDANDSAPNAECKIGEIWRIGCSNNIPRTVKTDFGPRFGVPYSNMDANRRLNYLEATDTEKRYFAHALLNEIKNWPQTFTRNETLYEFGDKLNSNVAPKIRIEKKGLYIIDKALSLSTMRIEAVWRQNEAVDFSVVNCATGHVVVYVSCKTATAYPHTFMQKSFPLNKAPNVRLCDCVIASYSGAHHKIAVMSRDTVYGAGKKHFYWNENKSSKMQGVRIFEDIRDPKTARAFSAHLVSFKRM